MVDTAERTTFDNYNNIHSGLRTLHVFSHTEFQKDEDWHLAEIAPVGVRQRRAYELVLPTNQPPAPTLKPTVLADPGQHSVADALFAEIVVMHAQAMTRQNELVGVFEKEQKITDLINDDPSLAPKIAELAHLKDVLDMANTDGNQKTYKNARARLFRKHEKYKTLVMDKEKFLKKGLKQIKPQVHPAQSELAESIIELLDNFTEADDMNLAEDEYSVWKHFRVWAYHHNDLTRGLESSN